MIELLSTNLLQKTPRGPSDKTFLLRAKAEDHSTSLEFFQVGSPHRWLGDRHGTPWQVPVFPIAHRPVDSRDN